MCSRRPAHPKKSAASKGERCPAARGPSRPFVYTQTPAANVIVLPAWRDAAIAARLARLRSCATAATGTSSRPQSGSSPRKADRRFSATRSSELRHQVGGVLHWPRERGGPSIGDDGTSTDRRDQTMKAILEHLRSLAMIVAGRRSSMLKLRLLLAAISACALWLGVASAAHAVRYSDAGTISINDATNASPKDIRAKATPYPSDISVSSLTGPVTKVTATLHGFHHDACSLLPSPIGEARWRTNIARSPTPRGGTSCGRRSLQPGFPGSVRGSRKWGNTRLSPNQVMAEMRSPSSVSTISPYGRAIAPCASGR